MGILNDRAKTLLALAQRLLRPLALGDVAGNRGGPGHFSAGVGEREHTQRNIDKAPIFSNSYRFKVLDALAAAETCKDLRQLLGSVGWGQDGNRLTQNFGGRIAIELLCAFVPARDNAFQGLANDRVIGRLDDGRQSEYLLLGAPAFVPQRLFLQGPANGGRQTGSAGL